MARGRLPAILVAALILDTLAALTVRVAVVVAQRAAGDPTWIFGVDAATGAAAVAGAGLLVAGTVRLGRVATARRELVSVAVAAAAVVGLIDVGTAALSMLPESPLSPEHLQRVYEVAWWCRATAVVLATAAIGGLGVRREQPATIGLFAALVGAGLLLHPVVPWLIEAVRAPIPWLVLSLVGTPAMVVLTIILGRRGVAPAGVGWAPAGFGLARVASALMAPVVIAGLAVPMLVLAIVSRSAGLARIVLLGAPAAGLIATGVLVRWLVHAAGADADGAPRLRLAGAAAAFATAAVLDLRVIVALWQAVHGHHPAELDRLGVQQMSWMMPCLGLTGMFLLLSALGAIAVRLRCPVRSSQLAGAALALVAVVGVAGWFTRTGPHGSGLALVVGLALLVAGIVVTVSIVRATHAIADAAAEHTGMPAAVARVRDAAAPEEAP
jgi:hypothetical protein